MDEKVHLVPALLCRIPELDYEGAFPEGILSTSENGITVIERSSIPDDSDELFPNFPRLVWVRDQFAGNHGVDFMIILDEPEPDSTSAVQGPEGPILYA